MACRPRLRFRRLHRCLWFLLSRSRCLLCFFCRCRFRCCGATSAARASATTTLCAAFLGSSLLGCDRLRLRRGFGFGFAVSFVGTGCLLHAGIRRLQRRLLRLHGTGPWLSSSSTLHLHPALVTHSPRPRQRRETKPQTAQRRGQVFSADCSVILCGLGSSSFAHALRSVSLLRTFVPNRDPRHACVLRPSSPRASPSVTIFCWTGAVESAVLARLYLRRRNGN